MFAKLVADLPLQDGTYAEILDSNGMVLASTIPEHVLNESQHRDHFIPLIESRQEDVDTYPATESGKEGSDEVIALVPLKEAPWSLAIQQPAEEVLAATYNLRGWLIFIGAVTLLVSVVLTWLNSQTSIVPIQQLLAATRRIASGNLATPVTVSGRDEIAELARGFEAMRQR